MRKKLHLTLENLETTLAGSTAQVSIKEENLGR